MRWLVKSFFAQDNLDAILVAEVENGAITSAHGYTFEPEMEFWGLRNLCGGKLLEPETWLPIPYDVFVSLGGDMNNRPIRLVEGGYIGRALSYPQIKKLPAGYCQHCLEDNLYCRPIVGTDKRLYCNRCLKPFKPIIK